jgi:hypothetical protein
VYGLTIKPLRTIHIILILYKDGHKHIGENSYIPSSAVTSSDLELRSDYQNLVEKVEKMFPKLDQTLLIDNAETRNQTERLARNSNPRN